MSADNCIAIGRFTRDGGYVWRVIHAQAIENCDLDEEFPPELTEASRVLYYGESEEYTDLGKACEQARALYEDCMICEYGIQQIHYDVPFPNMTREEAEAYAENYWKEFRCQK